MHYTNRLNLPDSIVNAIVDHDYDRGQSDITVTELLGPPQIRRLRTEHDAELTEDVADCGYRLLGSAVHKLLEKSESKAEVEARLYVTIDGVKIGGQFDRYLFETDGLLQDYKVMSVWEKIFGFRIEKEQQLNVLAYILNHNSKHVSKLEVVALYRDWQKSKAGDGKYPFTQMEVVDIDLWTDAEQLKFIRERLSAHANPSAECTQDERWKGNTRCKNYCIVRDFCPQFAALEKK